MQSTFGVYKPGIGITITRANIDLLRAVRAEANKQPPTPLDVVTEFATDTDRASRTFPESKLFKRRFERAYRIMTGHTPGPNAAATAAKKNPKGKKARKRQAA